MTVKRQGVDELLGLDKFTIDEENAHIRLNKEICANCKDKPCLVVCPAKLYKLNDNGEVSFDYAGCLECGTCRIMCKDKGIVLWKYPAGTLGVAFRCG
ncbi:ferredoxin family protein [Sporomusa acidovorans]|uniref:Ferredoxin-like protein FixX n=1 Tax=Sporomusa acidovorans (strain ATCC 49682 / DSM 3132 / Mol) TaxID=1123286 RepID=A0ABZ3IYD2_SPOA4|nr:4Fe-4S dicluster domain-containing protein [Sporomusa acidovorans]OZC16839.1 ferredoxin-like protein FixX [Sporomusa acidovorans DSM 3132]SDF24120.1 ferredoxin like protein [Sporomusa acidovorans]